MGRPNRGIATSGVKKSGNSAKGGGRDQYKGGGSKATK